MLSAIVPLLLLATLGGDDVAKLAPGDHQRTIEVAGRQRRYLVHIPDSYDGSRPTPVVLIFHGFGADGATMVRFCGMNAKADEEGFIAVYPYGSGARVFRLFNGGGARSEIARSLPDDIPFVDCLLDELCAAVNVDTRRIYATGFSNGAMMCHRLAAERSGRVAAIATVAGTMAEDLPLPTRPVPVLHFHGTADPAFSFQGGVDGASETFDVMSLEDTIAFWADQNACLKEPKVWEKEDQYDDGTTVRRESYQTKGEEVRVVLYIIEGAGHNWPGEQPPWFLGTWTREIIANDLIWDFFEQHPLEPEHERSGKAETR